MPEDPKALMSVSQKAEPNQSFLSRKEEEPLYSQAPQAGQSFPSTTVPKRARTAMGEASKAQEEYGQITSTYSRMRDIYNLRPCDGYSMFAAVFHEGDAARLSSKIRDARDAAKLMERIANGDINVINFVRKEYGKSHENLKRSAKVAATGPEAEPQAEPQASPEVDPEASPEMPVQEEEMLELIDYLHQRHFYTTENDLYNFTRGLYDKRDGWRDTVLALRYQFEADEDEGWLSATTKWFATIGTSKEALKYINNVQAMSLPKVPRHVSGVETRPLLLRDTNRHLDALANSPLAYIQEAYVKVNDKKDAAMKTAEVMLDVAEVTKAASEMVVTTGVSIISGGNPAAEALVSGLYSGALNLAEQGAKSSIAEGEFKKAKRELDASGMDPNSEEYKNALAVLEKKRKDAEVSVTEVLQEAGTSALTSIAPVGLKRAGKAIGASKTAMKARNIGNNAKKAVKKKMADNAKKRAQKKAAAAMKRWEKNPAKEFEKLEKSLAKAEKKAEKALKKGEKKAQKALERAEKKAEKTRKKAEKALAKQNEKMAKAFRKDFDKALAAQKRFEANPAKELKRRAAAQEKLRRKAEKALAKEIDKASKGLRNTGFGKKANKLYHKMFDWASDEAFAKRQLIRQMKAIDPKFKFDPKAFKSSEDMLKEFDKIVGESLKARKGKIGLDFDVASYLKKRSNYLGALDDAGKASAIAHSSTEQMNALGDKVKDFAMDKIKGRIGITIPEPLDAAKDFAKERAKHMAKSAGHALFPTLVDDPKEFDYAETAKGLFIDENHTLFGFLKDLFTKEDQPDFVPEELPELDKDLQEFSEEEEKGTEEEVDEEEKQEEEELDEVEEGEVETEEEEDETEGQDETNQPEEQEDNGENDE